MCPRSLDEDGLTHQLHESDSDQFNEQSDAYAMCENEPMNLAEIAQSITDSYSQTRQHKNDQAIQHNSYFAAVVDIEKEKEREILQSLGKLGISYFKATQLIEKYGRKRVAEGVEHTKDQECTNPAGYIIRALAEGWTFWSKPEKKTVPTEMEGHTLQENMQLLSSIMWFCIEIGLHIGKPLFDYHLSCLERGYVCLIHNPLYDLKGLKCYIMISNRKPSLWIKPFKFCLSFQQSNG